jgi:hypothetical protein
VAERCGLLHVSSVRRRCVRRIIIDTPMSRTKLTDEQKTYVVKRLAAHHKPRAIARDLERQSGITVTHHAIAAYDPGRGAGRHLAPRWRALFARERAAYLASTAAIGVARTELVPSRQRKARDPTIASTRLTDLQKIYVVRRLAAYDKPRVIAQDLARDYGVTVTIKAIESYNPCLAIGRHLGRRWRDLFAQAREDYLKSTAEIGVTQKAVRIRLRERYAQRAEEAGQFKAASDILDAIARDVGDILDKRQTHDRFKERGAAAAATIIINGRTAVGPAPEANARVRKQRD